MRIILADHHAQPRWALKTLLDEEPEFDLIGEAVEAQGLLKLAEEQPADLILVDRCLLGSSLENLITRLHALEPRPFVLVMSSDFESSRAVLNAGADAFVSKGEEPAWLLRTLHEYEKRLAQTGE